MIRWIKVAAFLICLAPFVFLLWNFFGPHPFDMSGWGLGLGANPVEAMEHWFGDWTLRFLLITLSITPLRKLLRMPSLIKFRRMFGLFAFFYGCAQAEVHNGGICWVRVVDSPGNHFHSRVDTAAGWKTVAGAASPDLLRCNCGGD